MEVSCFPCAHLDFLPTETLIGELKLQVNAECVRLSVSLSGDPSPPIVSCERLHRPQLTEALWKGDGLFLLITQNESTIGFDPVKLPIVWHTSPE